MSFSGVSLVGDGSSSTRRPASGTITVTDSGYHLLVIDGYSRTKDILTGEFLKSRPFRVGGYRWRIRYFPNGKSSDYADYVSLFLFMDDDSVTETVNAQFEFNFVDKHQRQVLSDIRASKVHDFKNQNSCWSHGSFMEREYLEKSTHLKDDSITIKCDIIVTREVNIGATTAPSIVVVPESDMHQHFTSLLQSGEGADVTFEVGGEILAAHRCILASRSTVFEAELLGRPTKKGSAASVIREDDMEARVFKLLLGFTYSDSVPEMEEEDDDVTWQHLLVVANQYDLPRLRLICEQKLCTFINTSSAGTVLALAEKHHCQGLKEACFKFLRVHANMQEVMVLGGLDHLTSSCPSVFKELIARLVSPKADGGAGAQQFVVVPESDMHRHFTGLLKSGEGTDVTFEVGGETITAHRCVLAARSAVFRAELFGHMKEATTTSAIHIDDMEAKVFRLLLSFIYSDLMPDIIDDEEDNANDAEVMWQHLLVAADRYDIHRLRLMCEEKLCGYINTTTVATLLELAEKHHCKGLKEACLDFLDFPANLQEVMAAGGLNYLGSSCPSVLIDLIAKLESLNKHNKAIIDDE